MDENNREPRELREKFPAARELKDCKGGEIFNRRLTLINADSQGCKPE